MRKTTWVMFILMAGIFNSCSFQQKGVELLLQEFKIDGNSVLPNQFRNLTADLRQQSHINLDSLGSQFTIHCIEKNKTLYLDFLNQNKKIETLKFKKLSKDSFYLSKKLAFNDIYLEKYLEGIYQLSFFDSKENHFYQISMVKQKSDVNEPTNLTQEIKENSVSFEAGMFEENEELTE